MVIFSTMHYEKLYTPLFASVSLGAVFIIKGMILSLGKYRGSIFLM